MSKPQALIEQVRSSVAVELERRHAPTLLADRKAAKAAKHKAKHHKYTKAAFFRYCYYDPAFKFFCEQVLDVDYLPLPEATRAASEVGVQNSSDYVCTPFKHILGDFAEALCQNSVNRWVPTSSSSSAARAGWATTASCRSPSCGTWATSSL